MAVIDQAVSDRNIASATRTLGTDNGTAFTSRRFRKARHHPPPRRLPRSRIAGVHRAMVRVHRDLPPPGPTAARITRRRHRSPAPGRITETTQSQRPERQHSRGPSHRRSHHALERASSWLIDYPCRAPTRRASTDHTLLPALSSQDRRGLAPVGEPEYSIRRT